MPSSTNIRFAGTYGAVNGTSLTVSIIDKEYTDDPMDFTIDLDGTGVEYSLLTDEKYIFNHIDTTNVKVSIVRDSEDINDFFFELIEAEEGRFFVELKEGAQLIFLGKIIIDEMKEDIKEYPTFTFTAIDGLTDLKKIDYTDTSPAKIKDIVLNCLNKIEAVSLYTDTEALLVTQSNLTADVTFSFTKIFEVMHCQNYFYKVENDVKVLMKCYDVLEEICGRLHCKIKYERGVFSFYGNVGLTEARTATFARYNKLGTAATGINPVYTDIDIEDICLNNGGFVYQAAYNEVILNVDKNFTNKFYGDVIKEINYPFLTSHVYTSLGFALSNQNYTFKIKNYLNALEYSGNLPNSFKIKYTIKLTKLSDGTFTETDYYCVYGLTKTTYYDEFKITGTEGDKTVEIKAAFDSFYPAGSYSFSILGNKIYYSFTKDKETETSYFKASLTSKNIKSKIIKNLASEKYGKDLVRFYFYNGTGVREEIQDDYRFNTSDTYKSLEACIVRHILSTLRKTQVYLKIGLNIKNNIILDAQRKYIFKDNEYRLIGYNRSYISDIAICTFWRIPTTDQTGIVIIEDIPVVSNVTGNLNNITNITSSTKIYATVAATTYTIDYDIPADASFESLVNSIDIYVEGVLWKQVTSIGTKRNCYTITAATKLVTFSRNLDSSNITIKINKNFISEQSF